MACEMDNLKLIDFLEEDDCLIPFPFSVPLEDVSFSERFDNVKVCDSVKLFGGVSCHVQPESLESRRLSFLRKSMDWNSIFFTSAGLLDTEELSVINKSFKVAGQDHISTNDDGLETLADDYFKNIKPLINKLPKKSNISISIRENMGVKTRGAGADLTLSKRHPNRDLSSKSATFTCATSDKNSKVYYSNGASFSTSPKRKNSLRNTKSTTSPSSVLSPLSSPSSLSTSPSSSFHDVISESEIHSSCENIDERKFTSPHDKRSSIGNIKSSRLRMPSPRVGFFDEPLFKGSTNGLNKVRPSNCSPLVCTENCSKLGKTHSKERDGRTVGTSSKQKTNRQIPKQISKIRMNLEGKSQKDDIGLIQGKAIIDKNKKPDRSYQCFLGSQKENPCSFEEQVNGLVLYGDLNKVNGQQRCVKPSLPSRTPPEPKGPSFSRKSLDWDSAFFTGIGLLNPEELCLVNEGLKKAESNPPSSRT